MTSYVKEWSKPPVLSELSLPGPNPFVPQDLSVIVPKGRVLKPGEKAKPPKVLQLPSDDVVWKVSSDRFDVFHLTEAAPMSCACATPSDCPT